MYKVLIFTVSLLMHDLCFGLETFDKTIENLIYEKVQDTRASIELNFESKFKFDSIKQQEDKIENIQLSHIDSGRQIFRAKINFINNKSDEISGSYSVFYDVPVAARLIKIGDIISPTDIKVQKVKSSRLKDLNVLSEKEVIGMQARRNLMSGIYIKLTDIAKPYAIKINDPVNLIYSSNNIELKTIGIAQGNGAIGDSIKVKNEDSGTILLGEIINKNTVQVGGN